MEEQRIVDKTRKAQDLEELNREAPADAHEGLLSQEVVAEFNMVTAAMKSVLSGAAVDQVARRLNPAQRFALERLSMAKNARDAETGNFVSGFVRSNHLNQALMHLQPILALGLRPDFCDGRAVYRQLVAQVNGVRQDITNAIWAQVMPPPQSNVSDQESDTPTPEDTDGDADASADEVDKTSDTRVGAEADQGAEGGADLAGKQSKPDMPDASTADASTADASTATAGEDSRAAEGLSSDRPKRP